MMWCGDRGIILAEGFEIVRWGERQRPTIIPAERDVLREKKRIRNDIY